MRKILLCILLCVALAVPTFATEDAFDEKLVLDNGNVLRPGQEEKMRLQLEPVSREFQVYLYVLTEATIGDQDMYDYAEKYFISNGLGCGEKQDGILLLLCMDRREWVIYANGVGDAAMSEEKVQAIGDQMRPELIEKNYVEAVTIFAEACMNDLEAEINREKNPIRAGVTTAVFFCAGGAIIVVGLLRKRRK